MILPENLLWIAQIVGVLAVASFLWSYQMKKRQGIIACNVISRVLYIVQYLLLGALEGAILDILGAIASVLAAQKGQPWIKKHLRGVVIGVDLIIVAVGLLLYENPFSLLPIAGVLLHTTAFWIENERTIRRVSLLGSPFWFVYNLFSRAYGSAVGDVLTMLSILIAMVRYGRTKTQNEGTVE